MIKQIINGVINFTDLSYIYIISLLKKTNSESSNFFYTSKSHINYLDKLEKD